MLTDGGLGIALLAPFSSERYFFDIRPISVSSFGVADFMSGRWTAVMASELQWIWLPSLGLAVAGFAASRLLVLPARAIQSRLSLAPATAMM